MSLQAGLDLVAQGALQAVVIWWDAIWHAMLGWVVLAPATIAAGYFALRWLLGRLRLTARFRATAVPPPDIATSNGRME